MDDFITTAEGHQLNLRAPRPGYLAPLTLAWSQAQINRFNGHALRPYSVAEHALLVCDVATFELHLDPWGQLYALMHDAHETVAGDMHSPGKQFIAGWVDWENRWRNVVLLAYGLNAASVAYRERVKKAHDIAFATECAVLLHPAAQRPTRALREEPWARVNLMDSARQRNDWEFWRDAWLDRFYDISGEIQQLVGDDAPRLPVYLNQRMPAGEAEA